MIPIYAAITCVLLTFASALSVTKTTPLFQQRGLTIGSMKENEMADRMLAEVEYRDIAGFPGYRVGDDGSVWSCRKRGFGFGKLDLTSWHEVKGRPGTKKYLLVSLCRDRKSHTKLVHRLVLEAFVGPCPKGMEACHGPVNDRTCNRLSNLRWDTPVANNGDKKQNGTHLSGDRISWAKINSAHVPTIRLAFANGASLTDLGKQYGVHRGSIRNVVYGKSWPDAGGPIALAQVVKAKWEQSK
jgi:hypothetical protein